MSNTAKHYRKIIRTVGVTGGAFAVNYLITFFLTPYITENVGTAAFGFVSMAKDFALYATYITIALNTYAARYISLDYHNNRIKEANIYFSSVFWGDLVLGTAVFALALVAIFHLDHLLQIPPELVSDVKLLFTFVFVKFWITTVLNVFGSSAYVANKLDLVGVFKGVSYCVEAITLLILFYCFRAKVYFVGIGILAASLVIGLSDYWICRRYTGQLRPRRRDYRFSAVKTLVVNGVWSSVSSLGYVLNSGLDLTICNLMLSPLAMGQLAFANSIGLIYSSLYSTVGNAFQPNYLKIYADNNIKKLLDEFKLAMKFSGFITNLFFAGFFTLGLTYFRLWIPNEDIELIFNLTMIVLGSHYLTSLENPLFYIYTLTLKRNVSCMFTLITGFLNVLSMYVLIKYFHMGIYVVVTTTLVLQAFIHLIPHPLYMAHVLHQPWHTFYPNIIMSLLSGAAMCLVFKGLYCLYAPTSWLTLIACALVYSVVGLFIYLPFMFKKDELKKMAAHVLRLVKH